MNAQPPFLRPYGAPQGIDPLEWRKSVERRLNELLDAAMALITELDLMEVDPDLEETGDDEPTLGWTGEGRGTTGLDMNVCHDDEREVEDENGGDIQDEPHDDNELEPFLGWSERFGQGPIVGQDISHTDYVLTGAGDDSEDVSGGCLGFSGTGNWEARDLLHKHGLVKMRRNVVFIE